MLRQTNDPTAARSAVDRWKQQQIRELALRALDQGTLLISPAEREVLRGAASDPDDDPGLDLDILLRTSAELDLPDLDRQTQRALAGSNRERRELEPWLREGLNALGVDGQTDPLGAARLVPALARARDDYLRALVAIGQGSPEAFEAALAPGQPEPDAAPLPAHVPDESPLPGPAGPVQAASPVAAPAPTRAETLPGPALQAAAPLGDVEALWRRFAQSRAEDGAWRPGEARSSIATLKVVLKIAPDFDPGRLTPAGVDAIRSCFLKLPAQYHCDPFAKVWNDEGYEATVALFARICSDPSVKDKPESLSAKTWNKHRTRLVQFAKWLVKMKLAGRETLEAFEGTFVKIKKARLHRQVALGFRDAWLPENIAKLFAAPPFTGCKSDWHWKEEGPLVYRSERFWVPLVATLHGMRRAEIAQLTVGRVREESGVCWYFDLMSPGPDLQLKSVETSPRFVPIHPILIELGFLQARIHDRAANDRVFPEAIPGSDIQLWGDGVGKWFGRLTSHLGMPEGHDLHAFRTTIITSLLSLGAPSSHVSEITGHELSERRSAFHDYDRGRLLSELYPELCRWKPPIDVERIKAAVARSEAIDRATVWPKLARTPRLVRTG